MKLSPEFTVCEIRKVCLLAILPLFFEHISKKYKLFCLLILIFKKWSDTKLHVKIWILVGMNDMNYDVDRSKDIYSCFQADKYIYYIANK